MKVVSFGTTGGSTRRVPVAISATHMHLTPGAVETLFGDHYRLHESCRLTQPTQYGAKESVTLIGPCGRLANVPVIGPPRSANQVEISQSDALAVGIVAPLRRSGDVDGTPGILVKGPRTAVELEGGVIRALRHVHMTPSDARYFGVKDGDRIAAIIDAHEPPAILPEVLVRVSDDCKLELHLDTEEANALGLHSGDCVALLNRSIKT